MVISMHFRVKVQNGVVIFFYFIFFLGGGGVCLKFLIFLGVNGRCWARAFG